MSLCKYIKNHVTAESVSIGIMKGFPGSLPIASTHNDGFPGFTAESDQSGIIQSDSLLGKWSRHNPGGSLPKNFCITVIADHQRSSASALSLTVSGRQRQRASASAISDNQSASTVVSDRQRLEILDFPPFGIVLEKQGF